MELDLDLRKSVQLHIQYILLDHIVAFVFPTFFGNTIKKVQHFFSEWWVSIWSDSTPSFYIMVYCLFQNKITVYGNIFIVSMSYTPQRGMWRLDRGILNRRFEASVLWKLGVLSVPSLQEREDQRGEPGSSKQEEDQPKQIQKTAFRKWLCTPSTETEQIFSTAYAGPMSESREGVYDWEAQTNSQVLKINPGVKRQNRLLPEAHHRTKTPRAGWRSTATYLQRHPRGKETSK